MSKSLKDILKEFIGYTVDFTELRMGSMIIAFKNLDGHKRAISFENCKYLHNSGLVGDKLFNFAFLDLPGVYLFNVLSDHFKEDPNGYFEIRLWTENVQNPKKPSSNKIILVAQDYKLLDSPKELMLQI